MDFEDSLVVFSCLILSVERSKEFLLLLHAVVVPLQWQREDECVSKVIYKEYNAGGAAAEPCEGSRILDKKRQPREYNPTRGYPGQDITCPPTHSISVVEDAEPQTAICETRLWLWSRQSPENRRGHN